MASKNCNKNCDKKILPEKISPNYDDNNYFEESSFSAHDGYHTDGSEEPKRYSKQYQYWRNPYDEFSDGEPIPQDRLPFPGMNPQQMQYPPFGESPFFQPFNGWNNNNNNNMWPNFNMPTPFLPPNICMQPQCGPNPIVEPVEPEKINTTSPQPQCDEPKKRIDTRKKAVRKKIKRRCPLKNNCRPVPNCQKKYTKNPKDHLNKALYFYYNQNPNYNPFQKPGSYLPGRFYNDQTDKSYYDKCPLNYYDVHDKINKYVNQLPKIEKTQNWLNNNTVANNGNNNNHNFNNFNNVPHRFMDPRKLRNLDSERIH